MMIKGIKIILYIFLFFYISTPSWAEKEGNAEWVGQIYSECIGKEKGGYIKKTFNDCSFNFKTFHENTKIEEQYLLSYNDPIEAFSFDFKYKSPFNSIYLMPPILGGMRDRFIDNDPQGNTLLFTTVIIGVGYKNELTWGKIHLDGSTVYLKQRHTGNYLHTTVERDPEINRIYAFDQTAFRSRLYIEMFLNSFFQILMHINSIQIYQNTDVFYDIEEQLTLLINLYKKKSFGIGLKTTQYIRYNKLNHDHKKVYFQFIRYGTYLIF